MKVKVSDYIADFLVDNGIDTMFMITGGGAMHLDDSLAIRKGCIVYLTTMSRDVLLRQKVIPD